VPAATRSIAARADFRAGSFQRALRKRRRNPAATSSTLRLAQRHGQPLRQLSTMSRDGAARPVSTKLQMTRGNLGIAGEIELAEMAALPPFAQVIADMDGLMRSARAVAEGSFMVEKPSMRISRVPLPRRKSNC